MSLWVDGRIRQPDEPVLRADDHGVVVGDGVFETVKLLDGQPFALGRHLARMARSAAGLGLVLDEDRVRAGIDAVLSADADDGQADAPRRLRVTLTGGPSPYSSDRGTADPTLVVATAPLSTWPPSAVVAIVPWTRNERAATAGLKTTSYADNVIALAAAHERGAAEAIFANTRGELCEGTGSNIFLGVEGRLVTPSLASGCLAGVTRELLLEWLGDVEERDLPVTSLLQAGEAFLASSTRDVQPIGRVDDVDLPWPGPLTNQAMAVFAAKSAENVDP